MLPSLFRAISQVIDWHDAMTKQMDTLIANDTFGPLVQLPPGKIALGCRWVFEAEPSLNGDGSIRKLSARCCAQGFSMRFGEDYENTFAPTVSATSFLSILAMAAQHRLFTRQIDFVAADLNGEMEHEVYIRQPPGFVDKNQPYAVRRFLKALYGTKQGGERWHATLVSYFINELGFSQTIADPCIFVLQESGNYMTIALHTDDCLLAHNNENWADEIVGKMNAKFPLTPQEVRATDARVFRDDGRGMPESRVER
jgi:hypothetical protein